MELVLACVLCGAAPALTTVIADRHASEVSLSIVVESDQSDPVAPARLALGHLEDHHGTGDGDHSDHMGPMWIMMGAMVAVVAIGMGIYFMRHSGAAHSLHASPVASPAQLALPVSVVRGGG